MGRVIYIIYNQMCEGFFACFFLQYITVSILYVRLASIKHDKTQKIIYLFLQIIHADLYGSALFSCTFISAYADTEK